MQKEGKAKIISKIQDSLATCSIGIVTEYRGLKTVDLIDLRKKLKETGAKYEVVKNTLARRAVEGTPFAKLADQMTGPLVYGISPDPVATAKVLNEFARTNEKLVIKAGGMPNAVITAKEVKALASMPSREQLIAQLLGTMQAPVAQFVRTLNEVPSRFVRTLAAVRDQKESAGA